MAVTNADKAKIYRQFKHSIGAPIREIELEDEMMDSFLEMSIENYAQYVQEWLIEHQWQSVLGQNITTTDMAFAMTVRNFDFVNQYTYAYSKQVGLQTNGPWELKKDYVTIEAGRQVYEIPAGREINEVLWVNPSTVNRALMGNFSGMDMGFGGGYAQTGASTGNVGGNAGYYIAPAFDVLLMAADMNLKNRMMRSDMTYKITAGPNGTRLLHLMSTPGSKVGFGGAGLTVAGCQVWYHYYDTTAENRDQCRLDNPDIIKLPNEVPLEELDYSTFNAPTKTLIRQLFFAEAKMALGRTRGKFGGIVGPPNAERVMDFESLLSEGNEEKKALLERLDARLLRLSSTAQLERSANEAENLNKTIKFQPLGFWVK